MSTAEVVGTEGFSKLAANLIQEYVQRVNAVRELLRNHLQDVLSYSSDERSWSVDTAYLKRDLLRAEASSTIPLQAAVSRFIKRVSQHLEHESIEDGDRWVLELRIADLEQTLDGLSREVDAIEGWINSQR